MNCYWVASDQPRMIRGRHGDECPGELAPVPPLAWIECDGCQPCTLDHCLVQWHKERGDCETHAVSVCPSCLAKTREHLSEIRRLSSLPLVAEALTKGIASEAADLLGPAADPKAWRQRGTYGHRFEPDSHVGEQHPLWVLGWYDLIVTEHQGHARTQRITIATAADYLARNLHFLAADLEFDFADMANTLADCRTHLDQVMHDGEQRETGAPCMECKTVRLELVREVGEDRWRCPRCTRSSNDAQYRLAVRATFVARSPELNADDMSTRTGVPSSTVRRWANVKRIQAEGEDAVEQPPMIGPVGNVSNRKVYLVTDVEYVRDNGAETLRGSDDAPLARRAAAAVVA